MSKGRNRRLALVAQDASQEGAQDMLKDVPQKNNSSHQPVCIVCRKVVANVYARIGEHYQACSKDCNKKYEALSYDEKKKLRDEVPAFQFKAPPPDTKPQKGPTTGWGLDDDTKGASFKQDTQPNRVKNK